MDSAWTSFESWSIATQTVAAIGPIFLGALALFGDTVRQWLGRPRLVLQVGNKRPLVELVEAPGQANDQSSVEKHIEIRIRLVNKGKTSTKRTRVVVDEVFKQRKNARSLYSIRRVIPAPIPWAHEDQERQVSPLLPTYLVIARISERLSSASGDEPESSKKPNPYSLNVLVGDRLAGAQTIQIPAGTVVLPVVVLADNLTEPIRSYIEIFWDGTNLDLSDAHLNVTTITEADFRARRGDHQ